MADTDRTRTDPQGQLFDELLRIKAGMLSVEGAPLHAQPMNHTLDLGRREIVFVTSDDTPLVAAVGEGATGHFTFIGKDHDVYACLRGPLRISRDEDRRREVWDATTAAWFQDGAEDPRVALLIMALVDGMLWTTDGNPVTFGIEIARANIQGDYVPHVGERAEIVFGRAEVA